MNMMIIWHECIEHDVKQKQEHETLKEDRLGESHRHHESKTFWVRVILASCVRPVWLKSLQYQATRPFG